MTDAKEMAELEALKKSVLRKVLTKEALERLGRVRLANPVIAAQLEMYLFQLHQTGQLKETIDDKKLKKILSVLVPKRKTKIRRK